MTFMTLVEEGSRSKGRWLKRQWRRQYLENTDKGKKNGNEKDKERSENEDK